MLAMIRRFAKSPAASLLLTLLVASFAVFGISDVFKNVGQRDAVVQVRGRAVSSTQFRAMFDRYLQGLGQKNGGQAPTIAEAAAQGLDVQALNEVTYEEASAAAIAAAGIRPGDAQVAGELSKAQRFFSPVTGAFDKRAYQAFLRENKISAAELEGNLRDQIAQRHYLTGLVAGLQAPRVYTLVNAALNTETRDFSYVTLDARSVPAPAKPTDAELQGFLKANAAQLTRPETRVVSLVRFSAALLAATTPADEAEVKKRFEFEKDSLSLPERRSVVIVPLKTAAQAGQVAARLKRGEPPAAVGKSVGAEAVVLADSPRTAIPDPSTAAAAFSMAAGEVRGPVQGSLGAFVVQVTSITPGREATLAEARPKIEAEVKKAAAAAKAEEASSKFDEAKGGGANFAEAAAKAGVVISRLPPFAAAGVGADGQPLPVPKKLVATAFQLPKGGESEVLQAGPGESYAIRVDEVRPAAPLTLEEVRGPLTQRLTLQKLAAALQAKADQVVAAATARGSLEGLAGPVQHVSGVDRRIASDPKSPYPAPLLGRVFGQKPGEIASAPGQGAQIYVVRLEKVAPASPQAVALGSRGSRQQATLALYDDLAGRAREGARALVKPRVDARRARQALGLDPDAKPAAPGGATSPAPAA